MLVSNMTLETFWILLDTNDLAFSVPTVVTVFFHFKHTNALKVGCSNSRTVVTCWFTQGPRATPKHLFMTLAFHKRLVSLL